MSARVPGDSRCKDCSNDHEPNRARCADCLARRRTEAAELAEGRRGKHKCVTCGAKAAKDRKYCATHLAYYAARAS